MMTPDKHSTHVSDGVIGSPRVSDAVLTAIQQEVLVRMAERVPPNIEGFNTTDGNLDGEMTTFGPGEMLTQNIIAPMIRALSKRHLDEARRPLVLPVFSDDTRRYVREFGWDTTFRGQRQRMFEEIREELLAARFDKLHRVLLGDRLQLLIDIQDVLCQTLEAQKEEATRDLPDFIRDESVVQQVIEALGQAQAALAAFCASPASEVKDAIGQLREVYSRKRLRELNVQLAQLRRSVEPHLGSPAGEAVILLVEQMSALLDLLEGIDQHSADMISDVLDAQSADPVGQRALDTIAQLQPQRFDEKLALVEQSFADMRRTYNLNKTLFDEICASVVDEGTRPDAVEAAIERLEAEVYCDKTTRVAGHIGSRKETSTLPPAFPTPENGQIARMNVPYEPAHLAQHERFGRYPDTVRETILGNNNFADLLTRFKVMEQHSRKVADDESYAVVDGALQPLFTNFEAAFLTMYRDHIAEAFEQGRPVVFGAMPSNGQDFAGHFVTYALLPVNYSGQPGILSLYQDSYVTDPANCVGFERMCLAIESKLGRHLERQVTHMQNPMGYAPQMDGNNCGLFTIFHTLALSLQAPVLQALTERYYEQHLGGIDLYDDSADNRQVIKQAQVAFYGDLQRAAHLAMAPLCAPITKFGSQVPGRGVPYAARLRAVLGGLVEASKDFGHGLGTYELDHFPYFDFRVPEDRSTIHIDDQGTVYDLATHGALPLERMLEWGAKDKEYVREYDEFRSEVINTISDFYGEPSGAREFLDYPEPERENGEDELARMAHHAINQVKHRHRVVDAAKLHCAFDVRSSKDVPRVYKELLLDKVKPANMMGALRYLISQMKLAVAERNPEQITQAIEILDEYLDEFSEEDIVREVYDAAYELMCADVARDEDLNEPSRQLLALGEHRHPAWVAARERTVAQALADIDEQIAQIEADESAQEAALAEANARQAELVDLLSRTGTGTSMFDVETFRPSQLPELPWAMDEEADDRQAEANLFESLFAPEANVDIPTLGATAGRVFNPHSRVVLGNSPLGNVERPAALEVADLPEVNLVAMRDGETDDRPESPTRP